MNIDRMKSEARTAIVLLKARALCAQSAAALAACDVLWMLGRGEASEVMRVHAADASHAAELVLFREMRELKREAQREEEARR